MEKNIVMLHDIIKDNGPGCKMEKWVRFTFNGYGIDKKLHSIREHLVLPLRICEAYHNYYLICYRKDKKSLYHYRIDLMTNLENVFVPAEKDNVKTLLKSGILCLRKNEK